MPNIKIEALDLDIPLSGSLRKHVKTGFSLVQKAPEAFALKAALGQRLSDVKLNKASVGFELTHDVPVHGDELTFEAGASSAIEVFQEGETVVDGDDFGPSGQLAAGPGRAYVGVSFDARAGIAASMDRGDISFGFKPEEQVRFVNYKDHAATTTLSAALQQGYGGFETPTTVADIKQALQGDGWTAFRATGKARLTFSAAVNFTSIGSPYVALDLPLTDSPLAFKNAGSIKVGVRAAVESDFELRILQVSETKFKLGFFNRDAEEFELTAAASFGVSGTVGSRNVLQMLVDALSSAPKVDRQFLEDAQLPEERIKELEDGVKKALDQTFQASLNLAFRQLREDEAAFLFTVDTAALDGAGEQAVEAALAGELDALTSGDVPGVTLERAVYREVSKKGREVRLNLFGVLNYRSVAEFLVSSEVVYEPESGVISFIDRAEAKRAGILLTGGLGNRKKLAKLYAEASILTAAYLACRGVLNEPHLRLDLWHFRQRADTSRARMKDLLDVPVALALLAEGEIDAELGAGIEEYGRSAILVHAAHSKEELALVFEEGGAPRSAESFVALARKALGLLYRKGDRNDAFRRLATDDRLWAELTARPAGDSVRRTLEREGMPVTASAIYYSVVSWSDAMADLSRSAVETRAYVASAPPTVDIVDGVPVITDAHFRALRKELKKRAKKAVKKTQATFGEPWSLVALDLASKRRSETTVRILTDELPLKAFERQPGSAPLMTSHAAS